MIVSTITAEPSDGSNSPGFCHVGEKGASLGGDRRSESSVFTFLVEYCSISFSFACSAASHFSFIVRILASSIFVFNHSHSISLHFFVRFPYMLFHFISILETIAMKKACAFFIAPIGIEFQCFLPFGVKKVVLSLELSFIFTCQ